MKESETSGNLELDKQGQEEQDKQSFLALCHSQFKRREEEGFG